MRTISERTSPLMMPVNLIESAPVPWVNSIRPLLNAKNGQNAVLKFLIKKECLLITGPVGQGV